jgi:hypothetical protein
MTSYGRKGGEGPTRNRTAVNYSGTFPDGTSFTKRAFFAKGPAFAAAYQDREGRWYVAGIDQDRAEVPPHYTAIPVLPIVAA